MSMNMLKQTTVDNRLSRSVSERKIDPSLLNLLLVLLVAVLAIAPLFPWRVTPANAPLDKFSGERALSHLPIIAQAPHPSGSPAQALVRDYLVQQLTDLGLEVEVQQARKVDNVVARLYGTDPSGAILLQAHYDSIGGPGAADNGSGVATLLEVMRTLTAGPALRNDIIVLFDDSEELPDPFTGTKLFVREHRWLADVRVAIGMDTAVRGFISVNDTGPDNGWMVQTLARAYTGGVWTSLTGGGGYDTQPFRQAGIRVLELEDNYPYYQQHTPADVPEIVNPGSVQQLGDQVLAVVRELSSLDLDNTSGEQQSFVYVPALGLAHYPQAWALPLTILAGALLVVAVGLALWRRLASWAGLGVALLASAATAGLTTIGISAIWRAAPDLFGWETHRWHDWPEVIPPHGWLLFVLSNLAVLVLTVVVYRSTRRWSSRVSFSMLGLFIFLLLAMVFTLSDPRGAIQVTWPVLIGSAVWIAAMVFSKDDRKWLLDAGAILAAIPTMLYILPLVPAIFMSDGTKSTAIMAGVLVIILVIILPAVDDLLARPDQSARANAQA
jgi:hypothetical protein